MTDDFIMIIECNICDIIFETFDDLQQHNESYHADLLPKSDEVKK